MRPETYNQRGASVATPVLRSVLRDETLWVFEQTRGGSQSCSFRMKSCDPELVPAAAFPRHMDFVGPADPHRWWTRHQEATFTVKYDKSFVAVAAVSPWGLIRSQSRSVFCLIAVDPVERHFCEKADHLIRLFLSFPLGFARLRWSFSLLSSHVLYAR